MSEAERWLQTRALLEVERRPITPTKLARIRSGRHRRRYQAVLDAYDRYRLLAERVDRTTIRSAVENYGLASRDNATLFELICTFRTIRALRDLGWRLDRLGIFAGSLHLHGQRGPSRLELTYQATPPRLSRGSTYRATQTAHSIQPGSLRPDLVIRRYGDTEEKWLLIEAKGGERRIEHSARAALFDLLAYRTAFAPVLEKQSGPYGLGVAFGAELMSSGSAEIMLCTPDGLPSALERFLV